MYFGGEESSHVGEYLDRVCSDATMVITDKKDEDALTDKREVLDTSRKRVGTEDIKALWKLWNMKVTHTRCRESQTY